MTIEYACKVEDYLALEYRPTKSSRRMDRNNIFFAASVGLNVGIYLFYKYFAPVQPGTFALLLTVLLSTLLALAWYFGFKYFVWFMTYSHYNGNELFVGDTQLAITADGIVQRRGNREVATPWDKVGRVAAEGNYTFIDTEGTTTYIVPHSRLQPEVYKSFMQALARGLEAHTLVPLENQTVAESPFVDVPVAEERATETTVLRRK